MKRQPQHVIVIGGGLSGLTAANEILKKSPETNVTVLEASDYLGGRTKSEVINGCNFDLGAQFIGATQHHVIQLAIQSKNELVPVNTLGRKIIQFKDEIGSHNSNIPDKVSIIALLQLQWSIWKINRMAKKVNNLNPRDCQMGFAWDSITLKSWLDQNLSFVKLKVMVEAAIRVILGVQLAEVSLLYFLYYVNQSGDFDNLINAEGGLQQKKTKLGTQHMSLYLGRQIQQKKGKIRLNFFVKKIYQDKQGCRVTNEEGEKIESDYLVIAMPPCHAGKIDFTPILSTQRRQICTKSFMGSLLKVIILYKKRYWYDKGFSGESLSDCYDSPVMNCFDDTRTNEKGQTQPALIVFIGGAIYRYWKERDDMKSVILEKLAEYYKESEMLHPIDIKWHAWDEERSIQGSPVSPFPPGTLSQITDLRKPEGKIHWAGTELATVSTGFMDGAIQSGKRVANQILKRLGGIQPSPGKLQVSPQLPYTKYVYSKSKWFQWW